LEQEWDIFTHFIQKLAENPAWKILAGFFIGLVKLMYGPVMRPAYGAVIILWFLDTVTGYYYAWKNPAIVPESRRMYHGLVKLCLYYFLLFLGYQCGQIMLTAILQGIIEGAILLTEGYSILENIEKTTELKGMEIPLVKTVMKLLKGKMAELNGEENEGGD
jgi:phage-related holin